MKKHIFSLVLLVILSGKAGSYTIQRLGLEQGLSNNYVMRITQDKQGIMWFATKSGLNRFDGREFKVFSKSDGNTISSNELNAVFADTKDNKIWIATARSGLNVFDCKTYTFSSYTHHQNDPTSLSYNGPTDIKSDPKGNLWIATYNGGVDYFDKQTLRFTHYNKSNVKGLSSNMIWCVSDDQQGNLYIAHVFDGLSVLSVKKRTARNYRHNPNDPTSIPSNGVLCVFVDSYKNVWVGTINGLGLFNPADGKFTVFRNIPGNNNSISSSYINCITETADKKLLIGTINGGLNMLDLKLLFFTRSEDKFKFEHIYAGMRDNELSHPYVKTVFHDSFGNIWIGTYGGGVNFSTNKNLFFHSYNYNPVVGNNNSLSHRVAAKLCIDNQNSVWIATDGGGIDVYQNNEKVSNYSRANGKIVENNILSAFTDSERNLWFGTFDGNIIHYITGSKTFNYLSCFDCKGIEIHCFFEDKNKNIWIGSNRGLHVYNLITHKTISYYISNSGITDNVVRTVSQDKEGNIWVGTLGGDICIFNAKFKRIKLLRPNNGLYGITQLYRDSKSRMWAATGENLYMFRSWNDNKFEIFGMSQGLADSYINAVVEGDDGRIWFSTNSGISSLNPDNKTVKNFNSFDGVPLGNFMEGAVAKSKNGIIYFGSENGVCYFNSHKRMEDCVIPPATITDFAVSKVEEGYTGKLKYFPVLDRIDLNYNQNTFTISFNVLDYSYNNRIEFSYMLEGLENTWYNVKNTKQVTFRNLPPGNYTFHVKSRYKNQEWSKEITSLPVRIHPPFWFSWWAEMIYGLIITALTIYFIRFYKRELLLENSLYLEQQNNLQQQELNAERLRFYTNITHELRTPLTLIIGPLEDLMNEKNLQELYSRKIKSIHKSATRLLELINQILEFRKTQTQNRKLCVHRADLSKQIKEICLKYEELNRNKEIQFKHIIGNGNFELVYDPEVITIILDNLISNALKYTPKGEIVLSLRNLIEDDIHYTEIEICDSGYGIQPEALPHIFERYYQAKGEHQVSGSGIGLSIVKNLVDLHEGVISVESRPGKGTVFHVRLISNNSYPDALRTEHKDNDVIDIMDATKPIMLIVEDNPDIQDYICETFCETFDVLMAENGQTGMEMAFVKIPDIIISDIMMPVMDGVEFCRKMKEDLRTCHIPFILLTAKDSIQDKTEGYSAGADSYITKPFSGSLLRSRVANLIESRRKITALFATSFSQKQAAIKESLSKLDNDFIEKITTFIEENLENEQINIAHVADKVFMSHSTLYRKIKALTGLSANEFIRKIKMQNAEKFMLAGECTVAEIMYRVGISSSTYFRKCFKEEFGVSPAEYLKNKKFT